MLYSSLGESAVMDELAHIPAGYGYVRYFDYRLNPEHPPLVKAIAALPLLFQKINFPTQSDYWQKEINGQWAVGDLFIYGSGNDADKIINWARLGPMIITLILIIFIYIWSKELVGKWWAFLPTILTSFSPAVLAHGHYVTTDIGAVLGVFISIYYFVKFLENKSGKNFLISGVFLGIAQLMKFSAVLLLPLFVFLFLAYSFAKSFKGYESFFGKLLEFIKQSLAHIGLFIGIFTVAFALVYAVYFVFTVNYPIKKQVSDTSFILTSFADGPDPSWSTCKPNSDISLSRRARCLANVNIWMAGNKVFRPIGEYMLGVLMVMQRSSGGNTSYFLGEVSASGWWYYFPAVFLLKEPLPSLILIALAILLATFKFIKNFRYSGIKQRLFNYIELNFAEFSMLSFVVFYWLYSIKSPLNIGVRHILPTIPLIYILSAQAIKNWIVKEKIVVGGFLKTLIKNLLNFFKTSLKTSLVIILVVWYLVETLMSAPYFISYFNEMGGGVWNGYKYVTDSNYDWGQDMKRLSLFVNKKKIDKIAVDYFGGANPKYYLNDKAAIWSSSKENPIYGGGINWIAISINTIQSATQKLYQGQLRNPKDEYQWLKKIKNIDKPDYRVGTSIFVYKL
ncbi:MAG: glycosyltransferase family 39 protein [Patescibacteria group bacterium]|nr:glycosyltransferase family 39 protein [Patescibacteria group bacterium]